MMAKNYLSATSSKVLQEMNKMNETTILRLSTEAVKNIIVDKKSFSKTLKNVFETADVTSEVKSNVAAFVGCVLRHYYVFEKFVVDNFDNLKTEQVIQVYLLLANKLFLKRLDNDVCLAFLEEEFEKSETPFEKEKNEQLFQKVGDEIPLMPESIDKGSYEFLSLRFNTPLWLVKMWVKHYGRGLTYKILKANSRPSSLSVRVNTILTTGEELLEKHPDSLAKSDIENMLIYKRRSSIRKESFSRDNLVFQESLSIKYLFDLLEIDYLKPTAIYAHDYNSSYLELAVRAKNSANFDIIVPGGKDLYQFRTGIANFKLSQRIKAYECSITGLVSVLSQPVSNFLVFPKSSNLEMLRSDPGYFFHFDPGSIDELIKSQMTTLEECSKFVENGGRLIYAIPTISKKEGTYMISNFIKNHPEFKLLVERQIFPFEHFDSCLYFAIISKEEPKLD